MPTTQYTAFATGGSANALTPSAWAALTTLRADGFQPGIALSEQVNTALRQAMTGVAGVAKFATDHGSLNCMDDASPTNFAAAIKSAIDALMAANQFWKSGDVKSTLNPTVPTGWLVCDGAVVSRATYAALFTAIGTTFGVGDGSTTFSLPDLRGEFLRGLDATRGADPSSPRTLGSWQVDSFKTHTHTLPASIVIEDGGSGGPGGTTSGNASVVGPTGATGTAETRPRNIAVLYLIKT